MLHYAKQLIFLPAATTKVAITIFLFQTIFNVLFKNVFYFSNIQRYDKNTQNLAQSNQSLQNKSVT